ncbi:MAG TPA: hypothetical protein VLQ45_03010 [Thermoanaerobaculia bacterium]|nr:hypothetical protein [Thermoanaerobaculia bacterium]
MKNALIIALALVMASAAGAQVEKFRYQPDKIGIGKVYHYSKTNLDGSDPEYISIWVEDRDRLQSFKLPPEGRQAGLVMAHMDWSTFSADRIESWQTWPDQEPRLVAKLAYLRPEKAVEVEVIPTGKPAEKVAIPRLPWHIYNFDLASLNFAFRHLIDPTGSFVVGLADPSFKDEGPVFFYRGEATVSYVGEEKRNGADCRKYRIDGPGLSNRGGFLWVNRKEEHVEDIEIDLPDNPNWKTFKFRLLGMDQMDRAGWEAFMKSRYSRKESPAGSLNP